MAHDFDDLIADLDAAKAGLARSVRRCRNFLGERKLPPMTLQPTPGEKSAFDWSVKR